LDQEIRNLEAIHQQVEKGREKMLRLAELQKKINEVAEEMRHIAQDTDQGHQPQQKDLRQEGPSHDNIWYDDFHHDSIAFDDTSPLATELKAIPWPPSYKPPNFPCMMVTRIRSSFS
jgi:hypothetical protein